MKLVDANIILRYLLDDHEELSPRAADILEQQEVTFPMEAIFTPPSFNYIVKYGE
ncbi:MAG: hypothetical protein R3F02_06505 [Thiolinea sp.]